MRDFLVTSREQGNEGAPSDNADLFEADREAAAKAKAAAEAQKAAAVPGLAGPQFEKTANAIVDEDEEL